LIDPAKNNKEFLTEKIKELGQLSEHKKRNGKIGYGHPDFRNRWCTQLLKKTPFSQYIKQFEEVVEYHGIAVDENIGY